MTKALNYKKYMLNIFLFFLWMQLLSSNTKILTEIKLNWKKLHNYL